MLGDLKNYFCIATIQGLQRPGLGIADPPHLDPTVNLCGERVFASIVIELPVKDSNPDYRDQNPVSCH